MAYVTNFTKRPVEMLLGLINTDNNFGLIESDVALKNLAPVATPEGKTYDTVVEIDLLTNEVQDDFVTFHYKRIALAELFSLVAPAVREVDVALNESGVPADGAVFYAEVLRKFGVAMTAADFDYNLKAPGVITISAKASNLAYTGSVDVAIVDSLVSRIANTLLDGFAADSLAA